MNSYVAILGRQPALGIAELERAFGANAVTPLNDSVALLRTDALVSIDRLGGSVKIARVALRTNANGWLGVSKQAVGHIERELAATSGKVTLGVSAYGFDVDARAVGKTGLIIKAKLKNRSGSVRLVPNDAPALSSAQTYHNKFGTSPLKRELVLVAGRDGHGYVAEVTGVQDIDAYTLRDRGKPFRDSLNGMLPPKLAQIILNLAMGPVKHGRTVLDPFCGSGTILIEAVLQGLGTYGTDLNPKMVAQSNGNTDWLAKKVTGTPVKVRIGEADATSHAWKPPFDLVASETFLGEPMAQEPKPEKLSRVMDDCETVIRGFMTNLAAQVPAGFPLCIAVPAWRVGGGVKHLAVVDDLGELGYNWIDFEHVDRSDLLYYREDQIVARELLVISRA